MPNIGGDRNLDKQGDVMQEPYVMHGVTKMTNM